VYVLFRIHLGRYLPVYFVRIPVPHFEALRIRITRLKRTGEKVALYRYVRYRYLSVLIIYLCIISVSARYRCEGEEGCPQWCASENSCLIKNGSEENDAIFCIIYFQLQQFKGTGTYTRLVRYGLIMI